MIALGPSFFFPLWVRTAAISLVALKNCSEISCYDGLLKKAGKRDRWRAILFGMVALNGSECVWLVWGDICFSW